MQVETHAVESLRPYARNARTHSNKQIKQIAKSIQRFGFYNPVLIDDERQIIAGHGRVEAAKLIGMSDGANCAALASQRGRQARLHPGRQPLAENAGWDREILAIELQALVTWISISRLTGFETAEIDGILEDAAESSWRLRGPEDYTPDLPQNPPTKTGDLWILGTHRLLCADAREKASYDVAA